MGKAKRTELASKEFIKLVLLIVMTFLILGSLLVFYIGIGMLTTAPMPSMGNTGYGINELFTQSSEEPNELGEGPGGMMFSGIQVPLMMTFIGFLALLGCFASVAIVLMFK